MRTQNLQKRVEALEARQAHARGPLWCDWRRKLAHCNASLAGLPWTCPGPMTPEKRALRDAKQARYQDYFKTLMIR